MEEYNKRLISLLKPILNRLSDERKNYLEEELNNVIKNNQAIRLLIAYDIVMYLKKKNYSYTFRGNIDSSYIAYELDISNVDCYELNIIPEQCYGFDYNYNYSICFNVGGKAQNKVLKFIDRTYGDRLFRQYSVFSDGNVSLNMINRLYVIDNTKTYKTKTIYQDGIGYKCLKAEDISNDDNIIKIIPCGHNQNDLIDDTLRLIKKHKNKNINYDNFKSLEDKSDIINQLLKHSKFNIDKLYCFEFSNNDINELIMNLKPNTYEDLVKICSLHHSTGAWENNQDESLDLSCIIATRDDVYDYLINNKFNKEEAFNISERVRKGKFKEMSASLSDRLPSSFINICSKISYLFPRGHFAAYINQDMFIMYLFYKYQNEISEAYLKQYKDFDYFNKIRFCNDYKQLSRYIEFFEKEKKLEDDIYKRKYNEIIKGLKFRMLLIKYDISEEEFLSGEYKTRYQQIEELRKIKVNKDEYLERLKTKYVARGIEKTFEEQYLKAEGHELDCKFFSPISSSRLCFELFSWMAFDGNIEDIEFEYFLPGLKSVHGYVVPQPNMDVYYENEDINFVESKFTEQSYNKKEDISKNYYDYYLDGNNNIGENALEVCNIRFDGNLIFAKHFIKLVNEILEYGEEHKLLNKKDWFDLKQEITHIFGIGQYIYKFRPTKNIKFTNLVYLFDDGVSQLAKHFRALVVNMMNIYINELELPILFFYDFKYMQDYVHELILNRRAFASNKKIKNIFKEYKLLEV